LIIRLLEGGGVEFYNSKEKERLFSGNATIESD